MTVQYKDLLVIEILAQQYSFIALSVKTKNNKLLLLTKLYLYNINVPNVLSLTIAKK